MMYQIKKLVLTQNLMKLIVIDKNGETQKIKKIPKNL